MSWLVIGDGNSASVYNDPKYLISWLTEIERQTAITNQKKERRKDSDRKRYKEMNLEKLNFEEQVNSLSSCTLHNIWPLTQQVYSAPPMSTHSAAALCIAHFSSFSSCILHHTWPLTQHLYTAPHMSTHSIVLPCTTHDHLFSSCTPHT